MLTEERVLAAINNNLAANTIEVKWLNVIKRDGIAIQSIPHRRAYMQEEAQEFLNEVPNGLAYTLIMGWVEP